MKRKPDSIKTEQRVLRKERAAHFSRLSGKIKQSKKIYKRKKRVVETG